VSGHELCPSCKPYGKCLFKEAAESIAEEVPPLEQQTKISPKGKGTLEASDAHGKITLYREQARRLNCPNVNLVNPDYPGKKNL
jgi:hypothetical protein